MKFFLGEIKDIYIRKNFEKIREIFLGLPFLQSQLKFYEIQFPAAVANFKYPHGRTFAPKDVIQTSLIGAGALTWNYALFDSTHLDITVTGPCTVRAFIGTYAEGNDV